MSKSTGQREMSKKILMGVAVVLAMGMLGMRPAQDAKQDAGGGKSVTAVQQAVWMPVSDGVLKELTDAGKKIGYPGGAAGVSVDRATGDVNMIVPDQGIWRSTDGGKTFLRVDGGNIGGRCETGYALNADPAGKRLTCFMLDGQSGMTLDNGKTWSAFQQHGRGWDFGAVDWSQQTPQHILAIHHESGQELHRSTDGGKSWTLLGKDFTAVGIFDSHAYVASKGDGILRSVDGGMTWTKVSDITPSGRTLCVERGIGYWLTREGLLVSRDKGATWQRQGSALEAAWGPFFGKDSKAIALVGRKGADSGLWETSDGGENWKLVAPFPTFDGKTRPDWTPSKQWAAGWFYNFGWDWRRGLFYASRMGNPVVSVKAK